MAGIFINGVYTMGFDMDPSPTQLFNGSLGSGGSMQTSGTPFSFGYLWAPNSGSGAYGVLLGVNLATLIKGIRFFVTSYPSAGQILFEWVDATTATIQISLRLDNTGSLQFYLGSGTGTPLGSPSGALSVTAGVWTYLETMVTINNTTGAVECKINGATAAISATGLNTRSSANNWVSQVNLLSLTSVSTKFDDWYMADTTAAAPLNTYWGPVWVKGDASSANSAVGGRNAWTPTNPTNVNHSNVANIPINTAEFNSDSTVGDYDMFQFPTISAVSVLLLNFWVAVNLASAGVRTLVINCDSGGTDSAGSPFTPPTGLPPQLFNQPYVVDPNTGVAWTVANAAAAEGGLKVNS